MQPPPFKRRKFLADLGDGKKAEEFIAKLYQERNPTCDFVTFYPGKEFDISISFPRKDSLHIEVKFDKYAVKSGNLCFELQDHKARPSGIMATEAHLMVFIVAKTLRDKNKMVFEFEVGRLRKFIEYHIDSGQYKIVKGGDNNAFEMMLVPIHDMEKQEFCKRIL
jgi:hypothetical protein